MNRYARHGERGLPRMFPVCEEHTINGSAIFYVRLALHGAEEVEMLHFLGPVALIDLVSTSLISKQVFFKLM